MMTTRLTSVTWVSWVSMMGRNLYSQSLPINLLLYWKSFEGTDWILSRFKLWLNPWSITLEIFTCIKKRESLLTLSLISSRVWVTSFLMPQNIPLESTFNTLDLIMRQLTNWLDPLLLSIMVRMLINFMDLLAVSLLRELILQAVFGQLMEETSRSLKEWWMCLEQNFWLTMKSRKLLVWEQLSKLQMSMGTNKFMMPSSLLILFHCLTWGLLTLMKLPWKELTKRRREDNIIRRLPLSSQEEDQETFHYLESTKLSSLTPHLPFSQSLNKDLFSPILATLVHSVSLMSTKFSAEIPWLRMKSHSCLMKWMRSK